MTPDRTVEEEVEESMKLRRMALEAKLPGKPRRPAQKLF
jgi:hypothetical protein